VRKSRFSEEQIIAVVGDDPAIGCNGDAVIGKINGALDASIDVERFGAADFALEVLTRPLGWYQNVHALRHNVLDVPPEQTRKAAFNPYSFDGDSR
jgi:hypothetical protein